MHQERKLNRLQGFDYRNEGLYFITICVEEMQQLFGRVAGSEMQLNAYGKIADEQFRWLENQYPYIVLHAWVIMPNHVHAILEITKQPGQEKTLSLSQLLGAYKTLSSRNIRLAGLPEFAWKRSFHDHIIRNQNAYDNILNYIKNNPANWEKDTFRSKSS